MSAYYSNTEKYNHDVYLCITIIIIDDIIDLSKIFLVIIITIVGTNHRNIIYIYVVLINTRRAPIISCDKTIKLKIQFE